MIIRWNCTNDSCGEQNHMEARHKLSISAGESEEFTDEVSCWQCGKRYYLTLKLNAELEKHELEK
jgi:hypothetical protein